MRFILGMALLASLLSHVNCATSVCNQDLYSKAIVENGKLIVKGPTQDYNGGNVTTYIILKNGTGCEGPTAVGFDMRLNLTSLPTADGVMSQPPPGCKEKPLSPGCPPPMDEIPVPFPGTNTTFNPFIWLGLYWVPIGHPPLDVFSLPHFDMHFWMLPKADSEAITPGTPPNVCTEGLSPESFYNAHMPVAKECFPDGIANINAVAPFMGNHYVNMKDPVVAAFGKGTPDPTLWQDPSFIVGGYKGKIVFLEPMVRQLTLENISKNATRKCFTPIIPAEMTNAGYYPTRFCIDTRIPGSIRVEMDTFNFQAEPGCNGTDYAEMSYLDSSPPPPNAEPLPAVCKAPMLHTAMAPGAGPSSSPSSPGSSSPSTPASSALNAMTGVIFTILLASTIAGMLLFI